MIGGLFENVVRAINTWKPSKKYGKEAGYRDDLMDYLRCELNKGGFLALSPWGCQYYRNTEGGFVILPWIGE